MNATVLHAPVEALTVRRFRDSDRLRWDAFVSACPGATFCHRIGWRSIYENELRHRTHYLVAERAGALVGVLPLVEVRSFLFGHALVSSPSAVYGGVATIDPGAMPQLHRMAIDIAVELGVEHLELRNSERSESGWPQQPLYVTFRKKLLPEPEANLLAIPRKQRAMVRKAIQRDLRSEVDSTCDRFFALYVDNMHRHGTPPHGKRYFQSLQRVFGDDCEVLTVLDAYGRPVSSVLSFYFRDEVLPYYAGDLSAARELAANDFKYWELMRRACERNLTFFDFGRSKRGTGSFDFKKNWGFEATPLHYEVRLLRRNTLPQHNPSNPQYRRAIALWRRLPRRVVNAVGPALARHLG